MGVMDANKMLFIDYTNCQGTHSLYITYPSTTGGVGVMNVITFFAIAKISNIIFFCFLAACNPPTIYTNKTVFTEF